MNAATVVEGMPLALHLVRNVDVGMNTGTAGC